MSDDLRKRLREAEKVMTEFMREEDETDEGGTLEGERSETGLTLIPSRRKRNPANQLTWSSDIARRLTLQVLLRAHCLNEASRRWQCGSLKTAHRRSRPKRR